MGRAAALTAGFLGLVLLHGACAASGPAPHNGGASAEAQITFVAGGEVDTSGDGAVTGRAGDGEGAGSPTGQAAWVIVGRATDDEVIARAHPADSAPSVAELDNPTEVGGPLVFQLIETELDEPDGWAEVHLPIRPNGSTGWVRLDELELSRNPYRIEIDAARHRLRVLEHGDEWLSTTVAIGTGSTPTPRGRFYITELLQPPDPDGIYGPFAFGLSGFSETLTSFAGGDGVIGIHGTNEPEALGTDVSHGCVRVENTVIATMAAVIPLGTPVEIVG